MTTVSDGANNKKRALGRGLDALLPTKPSAPTPADRAYFVCAIEKIAPQRGQPRRHFDAKALGELAQSIREHGVLEPLLVRKVGTDRFEIIAGERRWRASQRAGLRDVPVVVKDATEPQVFELALIENVQREDLNAVELAEAFDRLVKEHGYTQESLATRLGKDRSTISNSLRLLRLPAKVRDKVVTGELSEGHARSLLGVPDGQDRGGRREGHPRPAERARHRGAGPVEPREDDRVRRGQAGRRREPGRQDPRHPRPREPPDARPRDEGARSRRGQRGEVVIPYADLDALDRLIDKLV